MAYTGVWTDTLPWSDSENDRKFISYALINTFILSLVFVAIQFLPVPEVKEKKLEEVSPRLAKLIIEQKSKPKPPPPVVKKPKKKDKPKPKKEKKAEKPKPKKTPKPEPDASQVARKKAERQITAIQDALADLRDFDVASIEQSKPVKAAGSAKTNSSNTTAVIAAKAKQGSGGINTSSLSRDTGGGNLAGRQTTAVKSSLNADAGKKGSRSGSSGGKASRPYEDVELTFQKNKGTIFSLYNRALRKDPTLQGKVVLELTITADGRVTKCRIVSSELNNPTLERKLVARIKLFRFQARNNVASITVTYPIDFLPS